MFRPRPASHTALFSVRGGGPTDGQTSPHRGTKRQTVRRDLGWRPGPPPCPRAERRHTPGAHAQHTGQKTRNRTRVKDKSRGAEGKTRSRLTPFGVHLEPPLNTQQRAGRETPGGLGERERDMRSAARLWDQRSCVKKPFIHHGPARVRVLYSPRTRSGPGSGPRGPDGFSVSL